MKKFIISLFLICGILFAVKAFAVEDKKSIAVFPLNIPIGTTSYAMYSNSQDMFAADLVNSLQQYKDLDVVDISSAEKMMAIAGVENEYKKLLVQYKNRRVIDYEKVDMIAQALGVNYIVFIHGGFDVEKSFFKPNKAHEWQWIWASPIKPSAQVNMSVTLIDADKHTYILEENIKKDIPRENFQEATRDFAENIVQVSCIKEFTKPNALKMAQKIHAVIYPMLLRDNKFAKKDAFIDKFIPNNSTYEQNNLAPIYTNNQLRDPEYRNDTRRETYKNWIENQP